MHTTLNGYIHVYMSHTHACTHARMHAPKKCHHMQEHVHNYKCAYTGTHAYKQIRTMKMPYCLETEFLYKVLQNTQGEHFDLSLCVEGGTYHAFHPCISILQVL